MKKMYRTIFASAFFLSVSFGVTMLAQPHTVFAATAPSFGVAANYAVLSSTYTNTTVTTISGGVGFSTGPATAPLGVHAQYGAGTPYALAGIDQGVALSQLNSEVCTFTFAPGAIDLATDTTHSSSTGMYTPGVYCINGAASIGTAGITLTGPGVYLFRILGALTMVNGSVVTLQGASPCDVFWNPTGATTLGANTTFQGTVIDAAGVTVGAATQWTGRALAFGGTVTTDTDTITNTCMAASASLRVIKNVQNVGSSTATSSDFALHVTSGNSDVPGSPSFGTTSPGTLYVLWPSTFVVSELPNVLYTQIFSGDCNASGSVTLRAGENKTCSVTNIRIASPTTTATTTEQATTTTPTVSTSTTEVATTTTVMTHRSGGNSASRAINSSSAPAAPVAGEVLGASQVSPQVAAISLPLGAPNTGMGGAENEPNDILPAPVLLLILIGTLHFSRMKRVS